MRKFKDEITRIVKNTRFSIDQRIDKLLEIDCTMYTNLGIDSTEEEKLIVKNKSKIIYKALGVLDKDTSIQLLKALDK